MELAAHISDRANRAGVPMAPALAASLASYLALLARWNRKINLTALPIDPPTDDALDRLIVEPIIAAQRIQPGDALVVDIGSGGGSPAIPMKLAVPSVRLVMIEMKVRKCAFLREAVRHLALSNAVVENVALAELAPRADLHGAVDVVTVRAVRMDGALVRGIQSLLRPGGRVFWFSAADDQLEPGSATHLTASPEARVALPTGSELRVFVTSPRPA